MLVILKISSFVSNQKTGDGNQIKFKVGSGKASGTER